MLFDNPNNFTTTESDVVRVLREAKELRKIGLGQCITTAIWDAAADDNHKTGSLSQRAIGFICQAIAGEAKPDWNKVWIWHDCEFRTEAEKDAAFDRAISLAKAGG